MKKHAEIDIYYIDYYCYIVGDKEKPAILISSLLLRMRRMYAASIRFDFH